MALGYAWFDSYDSAGYVLTLHISPHTVRPYLPIPRGSADGRADVWAEGEGREKGGWTDSLLLEHGDDVIEFARILADACDHMLLKEHRQRAASALGRLPSWHLATRRRSRRGWLRGDDHSRSTQVF